MCVHGDAPKHQSVQPSRSVLPSSLWPHGLLHSRIPCQSPIPGVYSTSCPLSWWCHPTISSSVIPLSSCLQTSPASGSFPMSQFFTSGGQNIRASASASVLSMNVQDWFPLGWTGLISLQSKGLSRVFCNTTVQKHQFSVLSLLYGPTLKLVYDSWRSHSFSFNYTDLMALLFNMLSKFVHVFSDYNLKQLFLSNEYICQSEMVHCIFLSGGSLTCPDRAKIGSKWALACTDWMVKEADVISTFLPKILSDS